MYLFLMCCFDLTAVCTQQLAFQKDSSGFVAIIGYTVVVYGFLADYFIFQVTPTGLQIAAASLILLVNLVTTVIKLRQNTSK